MNIDDDDQEPTPSGDLTLQTLTLPRDTNSNGDIFGGWLMSTMDLAGAISAREIAKGRVTTVSVGGMAFLRPVPVGAVVSCYCEVLNIGRSSITCLIEVWIKLIESEELKKVTEAEFVYVAIDGKGRTRAID